MTICSAVTIAMHRWMSYKIWWVAHCKSEHADVSAIHLKYPVSHIPEDCRI